MAQTGHRNGIGEGWDQGGPHEGHGGQKLAQDHIDKGHRHSKQGFVRAHIQFFGEKPHGDGGHNKRENNGQHAKKVAQIGLIVEKKGSEEEPSRHQKEYGDDDVGNGGDEIDTKLLVEDM